jgi:hypothetical protein
MKTIMRPGNSGKGGTGKGVTSKAALSKRPPKLKGRVANDVYASPARSFASPPPQGDTSGGVKRK